MDQTTVTTFVNPAHWGYILEVLAVLDGLGLENNYQSTPRMSNVSLQPIKGWIQINVQVKLYLKFEMCVRKSTK